MNDTMFKIFIFLIKSLCDFLCKQTAVNLCSLCISHLSPAMTCSPDVTTCLWGRPISQSHNPAKLRAHQTSSPDCISTRQEYIIHILNCLPRKQVPQNAKINRLLVLPLEVQVIY